MSDGDTGVKKYWIGIDCEPGELRPDFFFRKVLKGTGLKAEDFDEPAKMFSAWTWTLKSGSDRQSKFLSARNTYYTRLSELYRQGAIRAGMIEPDPEELVVVPR